jgi:DNA-binding NtrC family response regulator
MGTMAQIIHYPQKTHVLIVEDDWVIREVLKEHFLDQPNCRLSFFSDLGQALYFLRLDCNAQLILSNINLSATGGINLSAPHLWQNQCEVVISPGYNTEADRFKAFDAGSELYRVHPLRFDALCRMMRVDEQVNSVTHQS